MNSDLDFVRELRPHSADPTAEVVQREREHLMQFIENSRPRTTGRRTAVIAAAVGVSILALGGVAAAAGLIPDAITDIFTTFEQRDGSIEVSSEQANMVASDSDGTNAVQLWVAPTEDGSRECEYVRSTWEQSDGGGAAEDGPVGCEDSLRPWTDSSFEVAGPADYLSSLDVFAIGSPEDGYEATAVTGAAHPDIASVVVDLQDGQQLTVEVTSPEGWFAVIVPGDATMATPLGVPSNPALHVTLLDKTGKVVANLDDWSHFRAQPIPGTQSD